MVASGRYGSACGSGGRSGQASTPAEQRSKTDVPVEIVNFEAPTDLRKMDFGALRNPLRPYEPDGNNYTDPELRINNSEFGRTSGAGGSRRFQFSSRFTF